MTQKMAEAKSANFSIKQCLKKCSNLIGIIKALKMKTCKIQKMKFTDQVAVRQKDKSKKMKKEEWGDLKRITTIMICIRVTKNELQKLSN